MNGNDNKKDKKEEIGHHEGENDQETKSGGSGVLEGLPPEERKRIQTFMSMGSVSGSILSPFESKINEKHIEKILDIKEKYDEKIFKDTQQSRKFLLIYILIGVFVFVFLTLFLVGKDTELFKEIIKLFIAFVGGMGAGFGIKHYMDR
jgi:hypothetical protein